MTRKLGDYEWRQLSLWEFAPDRCVEKYETKPHGTFHYYLRRVTQIDSTTQWRTDVVESLDGVPTDVLECSNGVVKVRAPKPPITT